MRIDCYLGFRRISLLLFFTVSAAWQAGKTEAAAEEENGIATDRAALVALYDSTGGTDWTSSDNWLTDEPLSAWHGVKVNAEGRVSELNLYNNNLNGSLPANLGDLSELEALKLGRDAIRGSIPSELGNLAKLWVLQIADAWLTGEIPSSFGQLASMIVLDLTNNDLTGPIPSELGNLSRLSTLHAPGNRLSGAVPDQIVNASRLRSLHLEFNHGLTGALPDGLKNLSFLKHIYLRGTQLCVPSDSAFRSFLSGLELFFSSGRDCGVTPLAKPVIDVAVFYTPESRLMAGGKTLIETEIDLWISATNTAYENSGANLQLRLVAVGEAPYRESEDPRTTLRRLEDPDDGYMDNLHKIRELSGADLTHLVLTSAFQCGAVRQIAPHPDDAFSWSRLNCGARTFAHELGHLMGLSHDRQMVCSGDELCNFRYPYGYGYVNQAAFVANAPSHHSRNWRTIMSYPNQCIFANLVCEQLMLFSNADLTQGENADPLGMAGEADVQGVVGPANAARAMNEMSHSVAAYRESVAFGPGSPQRTQAIPSASLVVGGSAASIDLTAAFSDPDNDTLTFWAQSENPSVLTVTATSTGVTLTPVAVGTTSVLVWAVDADGSRTSAWQQFEVGVDAADGRDYDTDDDGLIEISSLAQLDAMRYDPDGDGRVASFDGEYVAAFPNARQDRGCPGGIGSCVGYELTADLDFDTNGDGQVGVGDAYWNDGAGWPFIWSHDSIFEGNGHAIRNLYIDTGLSAGRETSQTGLFFELHERAQVRNLRLLDVDITRPDWAAGSLANSNYGKIIAVEVTGTVRGMFEVGGLVSKNSGTIVASRMSGVVHNSDGLIAGGLAGINYRSGNIVRSYASALVSASSDRQVWIWAIGSGGLVGANHGTVTASYATGRLDRVNLRQGGLVGFSTTVVDSYATTRVPGNATSIGGMAGATGPSTTIINTSSYWDRTTSGQAVTGNDLGSGQSTTELQTPTEFTGLYANWNTEREGVSAFSVPWDLGTDSQYPALKADINGDGIATWQEFGYQLRAGPELTFTSGSDQVQLSWTAVDTSAWVPPPSVSYTVLRSGQDQIAAVEVVASGLTGLYWADDDVTAGDNPSYQIEAHVGGGPAARSAIVSVMTDSAIVFAPVISTGSSIETVENATAVVTLTATDADTESANLTWTVSGGADQAKFAVTAAGVLRFTAPRDYEAPDDADGDGRYAVTVQVSDGANSATADLTVTLTNVNEVPTANAGRDQTGISGGATVILSGSGTDPDAGDTLSYAWSQTAGTSVTLTVADAASASFTAPDSLMADEDLTFALRVTDAAGLYAEDSVTVAVVGPSDPVQTDTEPSGGVDPPVDAADGRDYDTDDDGLIEISSLAQLDAMRIDPEGDGWVGVWNDDYAAAFPDARQDRGCPGGIGSCSGYELTADLDFDTNGDGQVGVGDAYWNDGSGWLPIHGLGTTFEGNGHAIRNLYIHTSGRAGLFRHTTQRAEIRNLKLPNVDITSTANAAGGLVSENRANIYAVEVSGTVRGMLHVGGLASSNTNDIVASRMSGVVHASDGRYFGGLVGLNDSGGRITRSYASALVSVQAQWSTGMAGGLVGANHGSVTASYATGRLDSVFLNHGGLAGSTWSTTDSYTTTRVPGEATSIGGMAGTARYDSATITTSYWDTSTSGQAVTESDLGAGQSTTELQTPTEFTGLYANWNTKRQGVSAHSVPWDLGTDSQYPALKADMNGDGIATWQEFGYQLRAGPQLTLASGSGQAQLSWTAVDTSAWVPPPSVSYTVLRSSQDRSAAVEVVASGLTELNWTDDDVTVGDNPSYQIEAHVGGGPAARSAIGSVTIDSAAVSAPVISVGTSIETAENATAVVTLTATDADTESANLTWTVSGGADQTQFAVTAAGVLRFTAPKDYEAPDDADGDGRYAVTVQVSDGANSTTADLTVTLTNVNEAPTADAGRDQADIPGGAAVTLSGSGTDPDAGDTLRFAWSQTGGTSVTLTGANTASASFTAPDSLTAVEDLTFALRVTDAGGLYGEDSVTVAVTGQPDTEPLTASFDGEPDAHGGADFKLNFRISTEPQGLSYVTMYNSLFEVTGGTIQRVRRLVPRNDGHWELTVRPSGDGPVTLALIPTTDCQVPPGVCDSLGRKLSGPLSLTVPGTAEQAGGVTAAPVITSTSSFSIAEGGTAIASLGATDADTETADLIWSLVGGADLASFAVTAVGGLSFTTPKDYENPDDAGGDGSYAVTVQVSDGTNSASADLTVALSNVNEAPTANAGRDQADIPGGAAVTLNGSGIDPDAGDTLSYAWSQTVGTSVTLSGADAASASFTAPDSLTADEDLTFALRVTDAGGLYGEDSVTVAVTGQPDEEQTDTGPLTASFDGEPDAHGGADFRLNFRISTEPQVLSYVTVRDSLFEVTDGTIQRARRLVSGNDRDWELTVRPSGDGPVTLALIPTTDCQVPPGVCDSLGRKLSGPLSLSVPGTAGQAGGVTAAPVITSASSFSIAEGGTAIASLGATDADTETADLIWSLVGGADLASFAVTAVGGLSFNAPKDYENPDDAGGDGRYAVTVQVSDGTNSASADLTVALSNVNEAPTANAGRDQADIPGGAIVTLNGAGIDPDAGDTLSYAWSQTAGTSVTLSGADAASASFTAPDSLTADEDLTFALRVTDAGGLYGEDSVTVAVTGQPDEEQTDTGPLTASFDGEPDAHGGADFKLNFRISAEPQGLNYVTVRDSLFEVTGGTIQRVRRLVPGNDGDWELTVRPSGDGPVTLALIPTTDCQVPPGVCDSLGRKLSGPLSLTVPGTARQPDVDETAAPVITSVSSFSIAEGGTAIASLGATDADTETADLIWSLVGGADLASFAVTAVGGLSFTAPKDYENPDDAGGDGRYAVTAQVSDGTNSASADLTVALTNVNEAPTADAGGDQAGIAEGAVVSLPGSGSDPDAGDAATLGYAWTQSTGPAVTLNGEDTATANFTAPTGLTEDTGFAFTLTVTDVGGLSHEDTVAITVVPAPPVATIAHATTPVTEGTAAEFTVSLDRNAPADLSIALRVTETGSMLAVAQPAAVDFAAGTSIQTVSVATVYDAVVESSSTVTALLAGGSGYRLGAAVSAQVVVEDNDAAAFRVTATPTTIFEGESAQIGVAISNGVTFAEDQEISLALTAGTATEADYELSPLRLTLAAGLDAVESQLDALVDGLEEQDETVTVTATHGTAHAGSVTVTIVDDADDNEWGERLADRDIALDSDAEPAGAWTDDEYVWVITNWEQREMKVYSLATGAEQPTRGFTLHDSLLPQDLWSDGTTLWVADFLGMVLAYSMSDGTRQPLLDLNADELAAAGNIRPSGIWSDGEIIWVADALASKAFAYRLADTSRLASRDIALEFGEEGAYYALGLWSDGQTLFNVGYQQRVLGFDLATGAISPPHEIDTGFSLRWPQGLASDGTTFWIVDRRNNRLAAYAAPGLNRD